VDDLPTFDEAAGLPNRNLLYNGAMQVHQRGTSASGLTGTIAYNTADRWALGCAGLGTWTQTVESDAPTGSGLSKSLKILCTTADASPAAGDVLAIYQSLEGQDLQRIAKGSSSAQQLTLSFWVKSNVTGTYISELVDTDNGRAVSISYSIASSATWERKTIVFPADTTGAFDNDNAISLSVRWWLGAGINFTSGTLQNAWGPTTSANRVVGQTNLAAATNNYWQVTGVQLEVGTAATPFEFKRFAQELRECQRYYYSMLFGNSGGDRSFGSGFTISTSNARIHMNFPVSMRVAPTLVATATNFSLGYNTFGNVTLGTVSIQEATNNSANIIAGGMSGLTANQPTLVYRPGTTAEFSFSAEL
jgi:hypothetical protein